MKGALTVGLLAAGAAVLLAAAPRPRPPMPKITKPVVFDTPEADAVLAALQVFPPDNAWNQDISALPVAADSKVLIDTIGADKNLGYNLDMGFIVVPSDQPRVRVKLIDYPAEFRSGSLSGAGQRAHRELRRCSATRTPRRCPRRARRSRTCSATAPANRHVIVVDPVNGKLFEFWQARKTDEGWQASNEATFDLKDGRAPA